MKTTNIACVKCGDKETPLHTNLICGNCYEPEHTPTPWKVDFHYRKATKKTGVYVSTDYPESLNNGARSIASMTGDYYEDAENVNIRKANAEFIVKAVNSHEAYERAVRNTFLRLKRVFEIETEFKPEVRILLAEALMFADEGMEASKQSEGR